jgi:hypothetical protein
VSGHNLIKTGDPDAFGAICDANGAVVLGYCRRCGRGESELSDPCGPTCGPWKAVPVKNDRLRRWMVVEDRPGPATVIAEKVRTEANARALADGFNARSIIRDLLNADEDGNAASTHNAAERARKFLGDDE